MTPSAVPSQRRRSVFRAYVAGSTTASLILGLAAFGYARQRPHFQEIDVERINVVEKDGKLRMTISDADRSPGWVFRGKVYPGRPKGAGMVFFNDEGEEDGGIGFGGRKADGRVNAYGELAFDQYDQDEAVTLSYADENGRRRQGLAVTDRADVPITEMLARRDAIRKLPAGAARDSAMAAFSENNGHPLAALRVFVGREPNGTAVVNLADPHGHPRLRLAVDSAGAATVQFLDARGKVTFSLPDSAHVGR